MKYILRINRTQHRWLISELTSSETARYCKEIDNVRFCCHELSDRSVLTHERYNSTLLVGFSYRALDMNMLFGEWASQYIDSRIGLEN